MDKCVFDLKQLSTSSGRPMLRSVRQLRHGTAEFYRVLSPNSILCKSSFDELPLTEGKADVKLYGEFSGLFDSYDFEIFDGEEKLADGNSENTLVSFAHGGQYRIVYTLKNGESVWEKKYERTVTVIKS
ncbi:MAG: hypothetical protein ACLRSW_12585 [Christensenellaceae bacterium]